MFLGKKYNWNYADAWANFSVEDCRSLGLRSERIDYILAQRKIFSKAVYLERCHKFNLEIIDIFSPKYPAILKQIYDPPIMLYVRGDFDKLSQLMISIVGTRHPTQYGVKATEQLVAEFKATNTTIVSGMALGIDTVAHRAALKSNLATVAVMGTGFETVYPPENRKLFEEICRSGAVISEYPFGLKPEKWHFPRRNRIITGLSKAVFVMEGAATSGAMISGKTALEQNRDVYALPGSIFSDKSLGPNWLIAQGASPLIDCRQTVQEITSGEQLVFNSQEQKKIFLTPEEEALYTKIPQEGIAVDELFEKSGVAFPQVMQQILGLELKGMISQLPGKRLVRV